jgi:N-acetylglucosamine-6-phosphate deacetylase
VISTFYTANRIFNGETWLTDHAIAVENGRIESLLPLSELTSSQKVTSYQSHSIVPAFIDLQIYGAESKLLAVYPGVDALEALVEHCREGGTAYCLPTVATNSKEIFHKCIDAVRIYREENGEEILGLHFEGPWLNPLKRGAHIESLIHPPTMEEVRGLLDQGEGVIKMITLAPEVCSDEVIDYILSRGIIISAGHSNATYKEGKAGFARGIQVATHLFNAMSPMQHREPGLPAAIMDDEHVMASIIPDGHHVDYAMIGIAKKIMKERLFAITDAVTETDSGAYPHQLAGDKYEASGILSGSALTMNQALKNLVVYAGIELGEAIRMCSLYPARVIRRDHELGMISPGYICKMVVLDEKLEIADVIM